MSIERLRIVWLYPDRPTVQSGRVDVVMTRGEYVTSRVVWSAPTEIFLESNWSGETVVSSPRRMNP